MNRLSHLISAGLLALAAGAATAADALPQPARVFSERNGGSAAAVKLAALRYAAFWNTRDPRYAELALDPDFLDRTLPEGRRQGTAGPLQAPQTFRAAVPDLKVEVTDMVLAADRVALRLHFTGHFSGKFGDIQGSGQAVDFQAFDLYRVKNGRIAENWHLEDNLTLLKQLGALKP
ncbi:ester cyclase [Chromobacterium violaceum]|uniref:Predicted ester cyclase n=1 Tax=Chromobacterium violaceum TaxID=536 RepID=A0AAX2M7K0_CHRVL|nr:ester cyclase [Chromobacterium violaceum]OLZ83401.1 ester cyclase [Chromobacterium violaceum]STB64162.1 Predicted ester cyclase [Chromobacterium violaceum]SUX32064.1 Predicted ester cyclase [Chromobacterium violaceum]